MRWCKNAAIRGGPDHFRHLIAHYRPRPQPEAYLRLRTLPGEQAQVDWGHFGKLTIGRAERTLMAFVMVLSFSRQIFLRFYLDMGGILDLFVFVVAAPMTGNDFGPIEDADLSGAGHDGECAMHVGGG